MYMFGGINVALVFFTYFYIPETKNKTLETMDELFGGVNHVDKGANMVDDVPEVKAQEIVEHAEDNKGNTRQEARV